LGSEAVAGMRLEGWVVGRRGVGKREESRFKARHCSIIPFSSFLAQPTHTHTHSLSLLIVVVAVAL
jgi:hypothetical protein